MKKSIALSMLILSIIALPLVVNADSAIDSKTDFSTILIENAAILSDAQLAEIRGGINVSISGEFYLSLPNAGSNIGVPDPGLEVILVPPEITIQIETDVNVIPFGYYVTDPLIPGGIPLP